MRLLFLVFSFISLVCQWMSFSVHVQNSQLTIWLQMPISIPSGHLPVTQFSRNVPSWDGGMSFVAAEATCLESGVKLLAILFILGVTISVLSIWHALKQADLPRSLASRRSGWSSRLHDKLAEALNDPLPKILTLDVTQNSNIFASNKVDSHALAAEPARSTNAVDVVFTVARQVVVDNQADLLNIDT